MPVILHVDVVCPEGEGSRPGRDIGHGYNVAMQNVAADGWVAFRDGDAYPCAYSTKRSWFEIPRAAVKACPDAGAFVAVTNRLIRNLSGWQMTTLDEISDDEQSIDVHWRVGTRRAQKFGATLEDWTYPERKHPQYKPFSGVWFMVSKETWRKIHGAPSGAKFVDWELHKRIRSAGLRVYLLPGLYLYHRYRYKIRGAE